MFLVAMLRPARLVDAPSAHIHTLPGACDPTCPRFERLKVREALELLESEELIVTTIDTDHFLSMV